MKNVLIKLAVSKFSVKIYTIPKCKKLGISSPDNIPDGYHGQDPRIWVYIKDK